MVNRPPTTRLLCHVPEPSSLFKRPLSVLSVSRPYRLTCPLPRPLASSSPCLLLCAFVLRPGPPPNHYVHTSHRAIIEAHIFELLQFMHTFDVAPPLMHEHIALLANLRRAVQEAERASRDDGTQQGSVSGVR